MFQKSSPGDAPELVYPSPTHNHLKKKKQQKTTNQKPQLKITILWAASFYFSIHKKYPDVNKIILYKIMSHFSHGI